MTPANPQVVYAWVGASGVAGGPAQGNDFQFVRTGDGGATWANRALPAVGVSLDYNMALAVDPADVTGNTVYVAGKGAGAPQASSMKKSTNGTSGATSHRRTEAPPPTTMRSLTPRQPLMTETTGRGRLSTQTSDRSNGPTSTWPRHGAVLGIGEPANADIAWGGLQDTARAVPDTAWPVARGGDGGVARIDQQPQPVYH